jgi:hypothetical protein
VYYPQKNIIKPLKKVRKGVIRAFKTLRERLFFNRYLANYIPVFVYQMGKVGSKSVFKSLSEQYLGVVLHAHYFNSKHKDWRVRRLYHWVMKGDRPLNVISLTREPIGRCVSGFFQNFENHTGVPYHKSNFSLEELKAIFLEKFKNGRILKWFDKNIRANFGIDVYANSFPKCGYATYQHNNIRLLVMQSEMDDKQKETVIRDFLELETFQIVNRNIGTQKVYASTYKDFKRNVKFPSDYIDQMCKSKYFNHFYEQDLINEVRSIWSESQ